MTRIIILAYDFSPNNGGIARLCKEIRKQCIATGTDYLVVTPVQGSDEDKVVRISGRRGVVEWKILHYLRSIKREGDVILTGTFHPDGLLAWLSGIPCYFLAHGAELMEGTTAFRKIIWEHYRKWMLAKAKKVITNSHYTAGLVSKCSPEANIVALPLGVDNEYFHPTKGKHNDGLLHLCSISRLEKFKAHDFIIETIASLPEEYRNKIRLTIGGKGPYKDVLEKMVEEKGLRQIVTFAGFISDEELRDFYSEHDVFILCTREDKATNHVEGFGLVFTEAQACGTPCIGTRAGGIPDAIDEGNGGWLIEQDDTNALMDLFVSLIDNPQLLLQQGANARKRVDTSCNWKAYFSELITMINNN